MSDNDKKAIRPEAQKLADAMQAAFEYAMEYREYLIKAREALLEFMDAELPENERLMVMDYGEHAEALWLEAAAPDTVKRIHAGIRKTGAARGIAMPYMASSYSDEYRALIKGSVTARNSSKVARR